MSLRFSALSCFISAAALVSLAPLQAEVFGLFTYQITGSTVQITDYPTEAAGPVVVPAQIEGRTVSAIGPNAFQFCTGITSVSMSDGLLTIGSNAFSYCAALVSVELPPTVTTIGANAFAYASGLPSLSIPASVNSMATTALIGCSGLTDISVDTANASFASQGGVLFNKSITTLIQYPLARPGDTYSIPSTVTTLADSAFDGCSTIASITIPPSVTSIGKSVFRGCSNLTSVSLPNTLTSIGIYAFANCDALTAITIPPSVTTIGSGAFYACPSLTGVLIPEQVSSIGSFVWARCQSLTGISVAAANPAYSSLEGVLFNKNQTRLIQYPAGKPGASYSVPATASTIGESAFDSCFQLSTVSLPEGLTGLDTGAFYNCTGLTQVILPSSLTSVGATAFFDCSNLQAVAFSGHAPTVGASAFANTTPGFTIYYLSSRTGFSSPTWQGYPATAIDEATYPAAPWLLGYGYWYDTDMHDDPEGDGVTLLTAYALDLDPTENQSGSLPAPVFTESTISLTFPADSPGVTYLVKTSTDLQTWTTEGVSQSTPGSDGKATATIARTGARQFMALFLEY